MPTITLPDGSEKQFDNPITVREVVESIGPGLAKAAVSARLDNVPVDLSCEVRENAGLQVITERDDEGLEVIRHSCAHLMAHAVKCLFPEAQVTIGPVIDNGFYYDFAYERPFTPEDLVAIEAKMTELAKEDIPVRRKTLPRDEAIAFFEGQGEAYKAEIIRDIPQGEVLSLYEQGDFIDLCRGPHVPSTGRIKAFKLMKLAGAYWRGDSNNEMLQRIYGTAWGDKKALKQYLHRLEEAEKRDHRKLAKQLDLFHMQDEAPGMVFWHPKGWSLYLAVQAYIRAKLELGGYREINTPELVDKKLWEQSGHWDMYGENMFVTESDSRDYAIKPMNCPCHVQVFRHRVRSYRDLPMRLAEFGSCHRYEPSGTLHGLMRVRAFVQDDAHIFCTEAQVMSESQRFIELLVEIYKDFGFNDILFKLSTRPAKRVGNDMLWDKAEQALGDALNAAGVEWEILPGEGAFYGPKIEFSLKDSLERVWQCGTLQLDYCLPERLGATYTAEDGSKQHPVMLHRAIIGSFERFLGIVLEESAGKLPPWLAPTQAVIMNITDKQQDYVKRLESTLMKAGVRVATDLRNEKVGFKIREQTLQKVPFQLIIGDKELENETVSVRTHGGYDYGAMSIEQFQTLLNEAVAKRSQYIEPKLED